MCIFYEIGFNIKIQPQYNITEELVTKVIWDEIRNAKININNRDMNKIGFSIQVTESKHIVAYFYFACSPTNIDHLLKRKQVSPKRIPVSPMRVEAVQDLSNKVGFNTPRANKELSKLADSSDDEFDFASSRGAPQRLEINITPKKPLSISTSAPKKVMDLSQFEDDDSDSGMF